MAGEGAGLLHNRPFLRPGSLGPHQEVWYLKLNDPAARRALWLRFTLLVRADGTRRIAETWAIAFERDGEQVSKTAVKQTHALDVFTTIPGSVPAFRIGDCTFSDSETSGTIVSGNDTVRWELRLRPRYPAAFNFVPDVLTRLGAVRNTAWTVFEDLRFEGWSEVNGERAEWRGAPGMQGHLAGAKNGYGWAWGHCNCFVGENGEPVDAIWDGLSARGRLGRKGATPQMTGMYVHYNQADYEVKGVWTALSTPSHYDLGNWQFKARAGALTFTGHVYATPEDFAGVTYEDTDGSFLYCYNSKVSSMTLLVERDGTPEARLSADGTVAFEVVTRNQRESVPLLL